MRTPDVLLVRADSGEWEGLYIDGKLLAEGHSLNLFDVLEALQPLLSGPRTVGQWEAQIESRLPPTVNELRREFWLRGA